MIHVTYGAGVRSLRPGTAGPAPRTASGPGPGPGPAVAGRGRGPRWQAGAGTGGGRPGTGGGGPGPTGANPAANRAGGPGAACDGAGGGQRGASPEAGDYFPAPVPHAGLAMHGFGARSPAALIPAERMMPCPVQRRPAPAGPARAASRPAGGLSQSLASRVSRGSSCGGRRLRLSAWPCWRPARPTTRARPGPLAGPRRPGRGRLTRPRRQAPLPGRRGRGPRHRSPCRCPRPPTSCRPAWPAKSSSRPDRTCCWRAASPRSPPPPLRCAGSTRRRAAPCRWGASTLPTHDAAGATLGGRTYVFGGGEQSSVATVQEITARQTGAAHVPPPWRGSCLARARTWSR